ncbi:biotin synthase BioB [Mannheimia massilioguelmaensis]|uniref:biotin synthase BioB n=1 Tax=Mannheimia massilioguelmaensis TaxID=1604354 RepID=UPI0005C7E802|nr:biotin synthase BioB [Mannheimia massilioguelmaensis]
MTILDIEAVKNRIIQGEELNKQDALELALHAPLQALCHAANEIREQLCGKKFNLCSIINVKSGRCPENCSYCAQSARFETDCETYDVLSQEAVLQFAQSHEAEDTHRFSLVASGRGIKENSRDLNKYCAIYEALEDKTSLHLCASLGLADVPALKQLKASGVQTYHHNLESSRRFYAKICTTHTYEDRVQTCKNALAVGMDICSGGIFGLGENMEDRIDMALELRSLGVTSVPINILTPIKGTPLENAPPLTTEEILRSIAIYRFLLPKAYLRFAGGRNNLGSEVKTALKSGINSALTGNFLTTQGDTIDSDKKMIKSLGFDLELGDDRRSKLTPLHNRYKSNFTTYYKQGIIPTINRSK